MLGFTFSFPGVALQFHLMEDLKMPPVAMAALMGVISTPWIFKPVYGIISDTFPLFGWRRKSYILLGCMVGGLSWWALPWAPDSIGLILFMGSLGLCVADVACDSLLVEAARKESEEDKGSVQSWAWGLRATGGLLASVLGPVAYKTLGAEITFVISGCVPLVFAAVTPALHERRVEKKAGGGTPILKLLESFKSPNIWKPTLFIFILNVTPGYGTVLAYFFEHVLHFTPYNFATMSVTGSISAIVGTIVYRRYLTQVPIRKIFTYSLLSSWTLRWVHIVLVNRWVPELDVTIAIVESIALTLIGQCILLPTVVLVAKICPENVEGSLYATVMSISNLAGVLDAEWGALIAHAWGIQRDNFDNIVYFIVLCNMMDLIPLGLLRLIDIKAQARL